MTGSTNRSFSDVFQDIAANIQEIVRSEVRLAKVEIQEETAKAARAAVNLAAGALLGLYAVGFLLLAGVYALNLALAPWISALIVTAVAGAIGGILLTRGLKRMKRVDPRPDKTIHSIKENLEWAKHQARSPERSKNGGPS